MQKKVSSYIEKYNMIPPDSTVIVGLSGGADSVCLFLILEALQETLHFRLAAVHVNHGLRGAAADADEAYAVRICRDKNVPCEVYHVNMREFARKEKLSEEEAGRRLRRRAFEETMEKYKGSRIALAHHQEDNAETFFLHLTRGSRLRGLGGIYPVNGAYIRPLLCVGRKEIEDYLEEKGISYCMDESNLEDTYTRNRIRNHVIPYLKEEINPKTVEHINGAMEQLRDVQEYLEKHVEYAWKECVQETKGSFLLGKTEYEKQDTLIQGMLLRRLLVRMAEKEQDIEEIHISAMKELMKKQSGRVADLPYQMRAIRTPEGIAPVRKEEAEETEEEAKESLLEIPKEGESILHFGKWEIRCRIFPNTGDNAEIPKKTYTKWFDYDIINKSIHVRTRRAGDKIIVDDKGSGQKLKSYFINEKIPSGQRAHIPLIAEGEQILWVVGYRQSKGYQVTEHTETILEININGGT